MCFDPINDRYIDIIIKLPPLLDIFLIFWFLVFGFFYILTPRSLIISMSGLIGNIKHHFNIVNNNNSPISINFVNRLKLTESQLCSYQSNDVKSNIQSYNDYFIWLNKLHFKIYGIFFLDFENKFKYRIDYLLSTWRYLKKKKTLHLHSVNVALNLIFFKLISSRSLRVDLF